MIIRIKKSLNKIKIAILIFLGLYVFSFMCLGSIPKLFYVMYPILGILGMLSIVSYLVLIPKNKMQLFMIFPLFFVSLALISTFLGTKAFPQIKTIILLTATTYIIYLVCVIINDIKKIIVTITIAGSIFTLTFIIVYFREIISLRFNRLGSFFGNENDVGTNLFFSAAFIVLSCITCRKYFFLPLSLIPALCSFTTGSKKSIIFFMVFILVIISYTLRKKKILLITFLSIFIIFVILLFNLPVFETIKNRILQTLGFFYGENTDGSTINRFLFMENSLFLGLHNFVFGLGGNGFEINSGFEVYSHNNLGEVLCNFGVAGMITFYTPTLLPIVNFNRYNENSRLIICLFVVFTTISSFTLVILDSKIYYLLLGIIIYLPRKQFTNEYIEYEYELIII